MIEDCVVGEHWPEISKGSSNQLKSLTITNCSAYFEELELLLAEAIYHGQRLIEKRKGY